MKPANIGQQKPVKNGCPARTIGVSLSSVLYHARVKISIGGHNWTHWSIMPTENLWPKRAFTYCGIGLREHICKLSPFRPLLINKLMIIGTVELTGVHQGRPNKFLLRDSRLWWCDTMYLLKCTMGPVRWVLRGCVGCGTILSTTMLTVDYPTVVFEWLQS